MLSRNTQPPLPGMCTNGASLGAEALIFHGGNCMYRHLHLLEVGKGKEKEKCFKVNWHLTTWMKNRGALQGRTLFVALRNLPGPPERRKYAVPAQPEQGDSTPSLLTHHDPKMFGKTASLMSMAQVSGDAEAPPAQSLKLRSGGTSSSCSHRHPDGRNLVKHTSMRGFLHREQGEDHSSDLTLVWGWHRADGCAWVWEGDGDIGSITSG